MGEKSGGMTNMIIAIVALIGIVSIINLAFPEITQSITDNMKNIVTNTFAKFTP